MDRYTGNSVSYITDRPSAALKNEVESYYQFESGIVDFPGSFPDIYTIFLPQTCVEMIFNYHGTSVRLGSINNSSQASGKIVGQHNLQTVCRAHNITMINKTFHVRFRPGAFQRIFGLPQVELKNASFGVYDVLGNTAKKMEDDLNNSDSFETRKDIIESFLLRYKNPAAPLKVIGRAESAIKLIQANPGRITVSDIRDSLGITERMLERTFSGCVGMSPREYIRVSRFKHVLALMMSNRNFTWQEHPESCDYFDDSHFIKEFKTATTFTPGYLRNQLNKKVVKSANFFLFRDTIESHQEKFFSDCIELEKQGSI